MGPEAARKCPAKGGQPPAEDRQLAPAPGIHKLGRREQGEHRSAHTQKATRRPRSRRRSRRRRRTTSSPTTDTPTPQRNRPRGQPAVGLRSPERVRGAGRGVTVTVVCGTRTRARACARRSVRPRGRARDPVQSDVQAPREAEARTTTTVDSVYYSAREREGGWRPRA